MTATAGTNCAPELLVESMAECIRYTAISDVLAEWGGTPSADSLAAAVIAFLHGK